MNQRGRKLDNFKEIIEKTVDVETMAKLKLSSNTYKIDQNCPQSNRPVQLTVAQFLHRARQTEDLHNEPGNRELIEALYEPKTSHLLPFRSPRSKKPDKKSEREKMEQYWQ